MTFTGDYDINYMLEFHASNIENVLVDVRILCRYCAAFLSNLHCWTNHWRSPDSKKTTNRARMCSPPWLEETIRSKYEYQKLFNTSKLKHITENAWKWVAKVPECNHTSKTKQRCQKRWDCYWISAPLTSITNQKHQLTYSKVRFFKQENFCKGKMLYLCTITVKIWCGMGIN